MTVMLAKIIWALGCVGWFVIRLPHQRRARKTAVATRVWHVREAVLLAISFSGLFIVPLVWVASGVPRVADYTFQPALAWGGTVMFAASLFLFYRTHHDLGRAWSVTLELRHKHTMVTQGVYRLVRHPMYSAFWLWAVAQALLLPNWVAGFAGLVGFGTLFFGRVGREEAMMADRFGDDYADYMARTKRVVPKIY